MDFNLHIELGNAAMQRPKDVAEALDSVAAKLRNGAFGGTILDNNGNSVGNYTFEGVTAEFEITEQATALDGEAHDLDDALDTIWGHGMADEETGEVDEGAGHTFRVGKFTRHTNSDGVKTTTEHDTPADAAERMDDVRINRYVDLPISYTITDGYQTAIKLGINIWRVTGNFDGSKPDEVRTLTDEDMLDTFGAE